MVTGYRPTSAAPNLCPQFEGRQPTKSSIGLKRRILWRYSQPAPKPPVPDEAAERGGEHLDG